MSIDKNQGNENYDVNKDYNTQVVSEQEYTDYRSGQDSQLPDGLSYPQGAQDVGDNIQMGFSDGINAGTDISPRWSFTVTLNGNGGTVNGLPVATLTFHGATTVGQLPWAMPFALFSGWSTSPTGAILHPQIVIESNVILFARWNNYNNMDRRALAREIQDRHHGRSVTGRRITLRELFSPPPALTNANGRSSYANIRDTANGGQATTRNGGSVFLSPDLLRAILRINDRFGNIAINTIAGGEHQGGARDEHIRGLAVDFGSSGWLVDHIGVRPEPILDYLERTWGFRTQRNSPWNDGVAGPGYIGNAVHFHLSIWGRDF